MLSLSNPISIVKGHYNAALEHIENYGLNHNLTWLQCIKVTLHDYIYNNTIEKDGNYVIYNRLYKPTLGMDVSYIVSIYVKKEDRGQGKARELVEMIPNNIVIGSIEGEEITRYEKFGTMYVLKCPIL